MVSGSKIRYKRRVRVLSDHLSPLIPRNARLLDVGCGDGHLAHSILQKRPDLEVRGIDVLIRNQSNIRIDLFDGQVIPYEDASFDAVAFINVLHHTEDPVILLREAVRVARKAILIKDHTSDGIFADSTLRFMDWIGNIGLGVTLPYNFWPKHRWIETFDMLDLKIGVWESDLKLYPWPTNWLFDRSLHFVARLDFS